MQYSLFTHIVFTAILYAIVGILFYQRTIIVDDNDQPIDDPEHFRGFTVFMAVIWPVTLVIIALVASESADHQNTEEIDATIEDEL